jgi:alpha-N-arabinofuranosidase
VRGRVLTAPVMNAHNTFDAPETIRPASFEGAKLKDGELSINLPSKSVVVLEIG